MLQLLQWYLPAVGAVKLQCTASRHTLYYCFYSNPVEKIFASCCWFISTILAWQYSTLPRWLIPVNYFIHNGSFRIPMPMQLMHVSVSLSRPMSFTPSPLWLLAGWKSRRSQQAPVFVKRDLSVPVLLSKNAICQKSHLGPFSHLEVHRWGQKCYYSFIHWRTTGNQATALTQTALVDWPLRHLILLCVRTCICVKVFVFI